MSEVSQADTGEFAVERLLKNLDGLAIQVNRAVTRRDADSVHDLRVACRRFLQALLTFKPVLPSGKKQIRRRVKKILSLAGAVRDYDIALQFLARKASPYAARLCRRLGAEREKAEQPLLEYLKQWVGRQMSRRWRRELKAAEFSASEQPARLESARRVLPRLAKSFFEHGDRAARLKSTAVEVHRFRLAAKKFRYTLELFTSAYPASSQWVRQTKSVQQVLGGVSDCESARALFSRLGNHPKLDAYLKQRARRKTAEFRRLWSSEFGALSPARQWPEIFERPNAGQPARKPVGRSSAAQPRALAVHA
ncbi:MAG TPA: CHAD domain-containing protein [Bryobacteraceae bacterium]|nr:CHAD domain-containing protein [Bryobacteraceae bacterium]